MSVRHWFLQLFIALDQLANVLITPLSTGAWADETLSCRAYRMHVKGRPWGRICRPLIDKIFFLIQRDHCRMAYDNAKKRINMPPEFRT